MKSNPALRFSACLIAGTILIQVPAKAAGPSAASTPSRNPYGVWAYMGSMPMLSESSPVRGKLIKASWADLEPEPGVWRWNDPEGQPGRKPLRASPAEEGFSKGLDNELAEAAKANLQIIVVLFAGSYAPDWIYAQGVPKVKTTGLRGVQSDTYPYHLDDTYQKLLQNMIARVREHLEKQPLEIRQHIMAVQAGFGSTGDYGPWHGTPIDPKLEINDAEFMAFFQKMSLYYQQQYATTQPPIRLLLNPGNNDPLLARALIPWVREHCPGGMIKAGNTGHLYQINGEKDQMQLLRRELFTRKAGDYLRARSEFGEDSRGGNWLEAPAWNMYSLLQAALHTGLDINCFERGNTFLSDPGYQPAFSFFNRYAGQKDPATAPGAWCGLRDGLDSSDTKRFPEAEYGESLLTNKDRFLKITAAFASRGAIQGDPEGGLISGIKSKNLKALNDVGWEIYTGNYELFLEQLEPASTSVGFWRVGPKDQPYGRYARGFQHSSGRDSLYFRLDGRFLPTGGGRQVSVRVVYFDQGVGTWALRYQGEGGNLRTAIEVKKTDTKRWQEITVPIEDGSFDGTGPHGCDLQLQNTDTEDDIFQLIEILRRS